MGMLTSPNTELYTLGRGIVSIAKWSDDQTIQTLDPTKTGPTITLSNGNLTAYKGGLGIVHNVSRGLYSKLSGKFYWEVTVDAVNPAWNPAVTPSNICIGYGLESGVSLILPLGTQVNSLAFHCSGSKVTNNISEAYGSSFGLGDVVGAAFDIDAGKFWFSINGIWQGGGDPTNGLNPAYSNPSIPGGAYPAVSLKRAGVQVSVNFGAINFIYGPPVGFEDTYTSIYFQDAGNCLDFNAIVSEDSIESYGSRAGALIVRESAVLRTHYEIVFTLDEFSADNLQRFLRATKAATNLLYANMSVDKHYVIRFVSDNPEGPNTKWYFWKVKLKPAGQIGLISDDWAVMRFTGQGEEDSTNSENSPFFDVWFVTTTSTTSTTASSTSSTSSTTSSTSSTSSTTSSTSSTSTTTTTA
jgi:hypothetical protein